MGDMAELYDWDFSDGEDGPPSPEDYLYMSDDELRRETAACRLTKLKSIRSWPRPLSPKQRYCLAAWLAERDLKYA